MSNDHRLSRSIGVTVGFGIKTDWWFRLLLGAGTTMGLASAVWFLGTRTGLLTLLADWVKSGRSYRG